MSHAINIQAFHAMEFDQEDRKCRNFDHLGGVGVL
jgi:hypothetical protein